MLSEVIMKKLRFKLILLALPVFLCAAGYPPADLELSKGEFLVATEKLQDSQFMQTVVLLVHYDKDGAFGLIINYPTKVGVSQALPDNEILKRLKQQLFFGG